MPSLGRLRVRRVCVSPLLVATVTVVLLHTGSVAAQFGGRNTAGPGRGGPGPVLKLLRDSPLPLYLSQ